MTSLLLTHSNLTTTADEGMWLFNNPPRNQLKEKYGFEVTDSWLEHVQKSSVRFNSGGSGSFVSEDGLVMSNHHVGADALQKFGYNMGAGVNFQMSHQLAVANAAAAAVINGSPPSRYRLYSTTWPSHSSFGQ